MLFTSHEDGSISASSARDGALLWTVSPETETETRKRDGSPQMLPITLGERTAVVVARKYGLLALDAASGQKLWWLGAGLVESFQFSADKTRVLIFPSGGRGVKLYLVPILNVP